MSVQLAATGRWREVVYRLAKLLRGDDPVEVLALLCESERWSPARFREAQAARLEALLLHAWENVPFLRPLMVDLLNRVGGYGYGMEKCFTRRALRRLVRDAGFQVVAESGILFMPGWLRMLDLWCHARGSPRARLTGPAVVAFAWFYRHVPALRRHGYLIACAVEKPRDRSFRSPASPVLPAVPPPML